LLSPDEREQLNELKDWCWQEKEAESRLEAAILAETADVAPAKPPLSHLLSITEEELKGAKLYEASLQPWYNERLNKFREQVAKEQRPVEELPKNLNRQQST